MLVGPTNEKRVLVSTEANKAIVRRYADEVWNKGNVDVADEIIPTDLVNHIARPTFCSRRSRKRQTLVQHF